MQPFASYVAAILFGLCVVVQGKGGNDIKNGPEHAIHVRKLCLSNSMASDSQRAVVAYVLQVEHPHYKKKGVEFDCDDSSTQVFDTCSFVW